MSTFVPEKLNLLASLRFCFFLKKSVNESHKLLKEAYGIHALPEEVCKNWFQKFQSGDFDLQIIKYEGSLNNCEDSKQQKLISTFVPKIIDLHLSSRFCFLLKKSVSESSRLLHDAYGKHTLTEITCTDWFQRFSKGNLDLGSKAHGSLRKIEDVNSSFVPETQDLRISLRFCFLLKKSAAESYRMLVEAYGKHALSETTCRDWFRKFKSGELDLKNEKRGRPPRKFEDAELQALLDKDNTQTQEKLAHRLNVTQRSISLRLKAMGKIQKRC